MRLIDADALWEIFREKQNSLTARCGGYRFLDGEDRAKYDRLEITLAYIENAPEVDVAPVVRGEWIAKKHAGDMAIYGGCSECGYEYNQSYFDGKNFKVIRLRGFSFCPNCGAKMEDKP